MSYQGIQAKIPLGEIGLLTDVAPDKAPPNSLLLATNICYFNGAIEKAPGALRWNAAPLTSGIIAAAYYQPSLVEPRFVVATEDGRIFKGRDREFGTAIATLPAPLPLSPNSVFVTGGAESATAQKKLFLFTAGATLPYVVRGDGTTASQITLPATDWTASGVYPTFGLVHRGQLWAFAGQISYASSSLDHEDFQNTTTSFAEPVYPGEGGELRGGFIYKGRMFAFKDGGYVYSLNDADSDTENWYWQRMASNFGLAAPNAIDEVFDDMVAGNTYGTVASYAASQKLGNIEAADIMRSAGISIYMRNFTSKSAVPVEHLLYYAEKNLLFMTSRSMYKTYNDQLIVLDYGRANVVRAAVWAKGSPQCLARYKDVNQVERPMYGDKDGYLYLMDHADRLEGGASYTGGFGLQHLDFSHIDPSFSAKEKIFEFLAVHYIPTGPGTLSCDYFIDGRYIDTVSFDLVQYQEPQLGTLILGTDRLGQNNQETSIRQVSGAGRTFSAYFYNSGSNESFKIPAITVYFRPGGDGAQNTGS